MEERDLVTVGLWLPLVMGCGETMPPSPEEHSRGHLSRVERGRAAGCRRTLPPPPLSPKTAAESSVSVSVSDSRSLLSLLCELMLRCYSVFCHRVMYPCLHFVLGVRSCLVLSFQ
ncbi:uncharacterized protein LOC110267556 isoform X1 [Arachis ipaensis]|uniref:uncharacterized protein LOC110267556 isoform X1 n=1 Tax=Arachis ipaensis TaxID=130454 RepID=UPI000A2B1777|nr:uncharacterized protein LOC110267556 isoform X1 [Arachis ipaensis]